MRLGPLEIGFILVIILIVFGVGKLPQVGGAIGRAIHEFRRAQQGHYDDENNQSTKSPGSTGKELTDNKDEK